MQIWEVMSDITLEKAQNVLLGNKCRQVEKNGGKAWNTTAHMHYNFNHQSQKVGGY